MPFFSFCIRIIEDSGKIQCCGTFDVGISLTFRRSVLPTSSSYSTNAKFCHIFLLILPSDKTYEIDDIFWFSGNSLSQFRILGCNSDRTGIQVGIHASLHTPWLHGAVANPNSSAPRSAAIATSRPLISFTVCLDTDSFLSVRSGSVSDVFLKVQAPTEVRYYG